MLDRSGTPRYEFWYPYHFILNGWQEAELRPFVWLGCGEQTPPDQTSPDQTPPLPPPPTPPDNYQAA